MDYRQAGVDVEAGRAFVQQIRQSVERTYRPEVLGSFGGFGGLFELPAGYRQPVLVSGTDGVGTKLKLAHDCQQHDTVGIDLVAMCVNDVLTAGAEPLFFLDYLATGKLEPDQLVQVVAGIALGCQQAGCALVGGETAEMPGFYAAGEYDLAGFCVGIVEKSQILSGAAVQPGDIAIGLASSGIHSNGYSLVRKIIEQSGVKLSDCPSELGDQTLADLLLTPTQIYVKPVLAALRAGLKIHGMAHITGGGLPENLPRCLGEHQSVRVAHGSWPVPPIFGWLAAVGGVTLPEMYSTFNMGIGYVLIAPPAQVEPLIAQLTAEAIAAYSIGEVIAGNGELVWAGI